MDDLPYRERGIHITILRHPHGFEWMMFNVPQQQKRAIERRIAKGQPLTGYGWPGMRVRWCTGQLKTHLIRKEVNRLKKEKNALHHIGIAVDEAHRCKDDPQNRYSSGGVSAAESPTVRSSEEGQTKTESVFLLVCLPYAISLVQTSSARIFPADQTLTAAKPI